MFILTETWLDERIESNEYNIPDFDSDFNNVGRGRGIASYYKHMYKHQTNVNGEGFSISKTVSENLDVIGIYRSQEGNLQNLMKQLEALITEEKPTMIGGDMNLCALAHPKNHMTETLREWGFSQLVRKPTHIEGGLIDHVYFIPGKLIKFSYKLEYFPKYYSDHDGLGIILTEIKED